MGKVENVTISRGEWSRTVLQSRYRIGGYGRRMRPYSDVLATIRCASSSCYTGPLSPSASRTCCRAPHPPQCRPAIGSPLSNRDQNAPPELNSGLAIRGERGTFGAVASRITQRTPCRAVSDVSTAAYVDNQIISGRRAEPCAMFYRQAPAGPTEKALPALPPKDDSDDSGDAASTYAADGEESGPEQWPNEKCERHSLADSAGSSLMFPRPNPSRGRSDHVQKYRQGPRLGSDRRR